MNNRIRPILQWWGPLILLACFAYILETHMYIHKDVAYILHEASLMLKGETYAHDIFEPNPPLILFLSMPPLLLSKLTGIDILYTMRFYVIILAVISCGLSYFLIHKIFSKNIFAIFIAYVVAFTLLFLPAHQFGQREHFLMIFIYPYLFAASLRFRSENIRPLFALIIGCMAGIGFAIKPHFLTVLILIELYFVIQKRNIFAWVRIESITIALLLFTYLASILLCFPAYLKIVYPLWWPYYTALAHPWHVMILYPSFLVAAGALIFYCFMKNRSSEISRVFMLALSGLLITFLVPRVAWYYHIYPALSVACVLYAILLGQLAADTFKKSKLKSDYIFITLLALVFFAYPLYLTTCYFIISLKDFRKTAAPEQLISYLETNAPNNSFDFFSNTHDFIIIEFYSKAHYVGRFPSLWWLYDLPIRKYRDSEKANRYEETKFPLFNDWIADDLQTKKPALVIVDTLSAEESLGMPLNYINKLSDSKKFRIAWRKYHYYKTIDRYRLYVRSE